MKMVDQKARYGVVSDPLCPECGEADDLVPL
jgi:hypothetical protein